MDQIKSPARFFVKPPGLPPSLHARIVHADKPIGHNGRMPKLDIKQVLARNLLEAMEKSPSLDTQLKLAKRAQISQSHLSEILRGVSVPTIVLVNDLAHALGLQPWELLADSETTRQAALARLMWGGNVSDQKVEQPLPAAPKSKSRKRGRPRLPGTWDPEK